MKGIIDPVDDVRVSNPASNPELLDTLAKHFNGTSAIATIYRKPHSPKYHVSAVREIDGWIKFPWEGEHGPEDAVVRLLQWIGEDPKRDGLLDTRSCP